MIPAPLPASVGCRRKGSLGIGVSGVDVGAENGDKVLEERNKVNCGAPAAAKSRTSEDQASSQGINIRNIIVNPFYNYASSAPKPFTSA